jgi:4-alpha-glucanotransferase
MSSLPLFPWLKQRTAGLLLHPTALPSSTGIGNFGPAAYALVDFLADCQIRNWQMCPLGPTGFGDSPYQCFSAFAGNPYLIDLTPLVEAGLLKTEELAPLEALPADHTDYGALSESMWPVINLACQRFHKQHNSLPQYGSYASFCKAEAFWLDGYAAFQALKQHYEGQPWYLWPEEHKSYRQANESGILKKLAEAIQDQCFLQYVFYGQWRELRTYANRKGIAIIGDIPIFVARDSADVWTHPELFALDAELQPTEVAGVPPDYFSSTGQLWGNPLYNWDKLKATGYTWWMERFAANFALFDIVRLDHFRGFFDYWAIPADSPDARGGTWKPGPGLAFFEALKKRFPQAKIIAEDLGEINDGVRQLRKDTGLPGMAILHFAFGSGSDNLYLPHNVESNCVIYPGTHDNDTSQGWYRSAPPNIQDEFRRYFRCNGENAHWDMIQGAYKSVCKLAVVSLQDVMGLGSEARFNTPGHPAGNWQWRYSADALESLRMQVRDHFRELAAQTGREGPKPTTQ